MKAIFADSYYFIALANVRDADHVRVLSVAKTIRTPMVTTEAVLVEFADAMAAEACRPGVRQFIHILRNSRSVEVISTDTGLLEAGLNLYADRPDKEWSLTDCISFEVMRTRRLTDALTHDHHFRQAGFRTLL